MSLHRREVSAEWRTWLYWLFSVLYFASCRSLTALLHSWISWLCKADIIRIIIHHVCALMVHERPYCAVLAVTLLQIAGWSLQYFGSGQVLSGVATRFKVYMCWLKSFLLALWLCTQSKNKQVRWILKLKWNYRTEYLSLCEFKHLDIICKR